MDDSKETLDKLFHYGNRILDELEKASAEKSQQLEKAERRCENLRQGLQELLNRHED